MSEIPKDMLTTEGQAWTTCVHFTGTANPPCKAGMSYPEEGELPCFRCYGNGKGCGKAQFRTPEEAKEEAQRVTEEFRVHALERAKEMVGAAASGNRRGRRRRAAKERGEFPCPMCRVRVFRWTRAGRTLFGRCEDPDCIGL